MDQKRTTEQPQEIHLADGHARHLHGRALRANGVVDDALGQFQRQVKQWKQQGGDDQQNQLIAFRILPYELK